MTRAPGFDARVTALRGLIAERATVLHELFPDP